VSSLSNNFPRTTPRFELVIPAGQTGWMKFWSTNAAETGLFGAVFNRNGNALAAAGAFQGAHNMHKLTLTPSASFIVPIFPPNCGFVRVGDGDGDTQ
jgi:hypothetical protein